MKSINKFRNGTFYVTGIAFICYIVSSIILKLFNLQYRAWVNVFCIAVVCVCLLLGLVLSYISFNSIKKKLLLLIAFLLSLGFIWICRLPIVIFCEAIPHKDRVDTIDGRKPYMSSNEVFLTTTQALYYLSGIDEQKVEVVQMDEYINKKYINNEKLKLPLYFYYIISVTYMSIGMLMN